MNKSMTIAGLIVLLIVALAGYASAQTVVDRAQIEDQDGVVYKQGEKTPFSGKAVAKSESGQILSEEIYEGGKIVSAKQWNKDGKLVEQLSVSQGAWTRKLFTDNGALEEETVMVYKDGKKVSESVKLWHENGKLKLEASFINEKPNGTIKQYDASGAVAKEEVYDNGKLVKKIK